ncbi:hypothetical protein IK110_03585 [Candidatus Saccharibacteria bacterium]|nr:hypothetical protein [Candidatus Saccharibacteria bacterium]
MGDSKLEIRENAIYEISGNLAYNDWRTGDAKWEAEEYKLAFVGRIRVEKGDFFRGYMLKLYRLSTISPSLDEVEIPIIGRFVKGRNNSTTLILATLDGFNDRCWIEKRVEKIGGYGIFTGACNGDKEMWSKMSFDGYFRCGIREVCADDLERREALAAIVTGTYSRLVTRRFDNKEKAAESFFEKYQFIEGKLLDLIDEHEGVSAKIAYPDKK